VTAHFLSATQNAARAKHIIDIKAGFNRQIPELVATVSVLEFFPRFVNALRVPVTSAAKTVRQGESECDR
jgi:hypothetical protein